MNSHRRLISLLLGICCHRLSYKCKHRNRKTSWIHILFIFILILSKNWILCMGYNCRKSQSQRILTHRLYGGYLWCLRPVGRRWVWLPNKSLNYFLANKCHFYLHTFYFFNYQITCEIHQWRISPILQYETCSNEANHPNIRKTQTQKWCRHFLID